MKKITTLLLSVLMLFVCVLTASCSSGDESSSKTESSADVISAEDFVGEYKSTFVDSQNNEDSIHFTLYLEADKTFFLTGHKIYRGTWKSYTESGKAQLLCIVESGYTFNSNYPNAWNPYFTLCFLDDGTLMATGGATNSSMSVASAFGYGDVTAITLILFERQ